MLNRTARMFCAAAVVFCAAIISMPTAYAVSTLNCGAALASIFKSEDLPTSTTSQSFVDVPGASTSISLGATSRVKVVFSAEADCGGTGFRTCIIRALLDGVEMRPTGSGNRDFASIGGSAAHTYVWALSVRAGINHRIRIQRRVSNAIASFRLDDWTFDVQLYEQPS